MIIDKDGIQRLVREEDFLKGKTKLHTFGLYTWLYLILIPILLVWQMLLFLYFLVKLPVVIIISVLELARVTKEDPSHVYICKKCNRVFWIGQLDESHCPDCDAEVRCKKLEDLA